VAAARCPVDVSTYPQRHMIVVKHAGERQTFSVHEVAHNHVEWVGGRDITTLVMLPLSASRPRKWLGGHDDLRCIPFILRGTPQGTAMILRERHATGPRFRYIVAGERGAAEYVTLAGFPLAISYHSAQPLDGVRPMPCDVLEGPCYVRQDGPRRPEAVRATAGSRQGRGGRLACSGREVLPLGISRARRRRTLSFPEGKGRVVRQNVASVVVPASSGLPWTGQR